MVTLPADIHILVLMGGWANEREVSLMSGNGVADALESRGHRVTRLDMDRDVAARIAEAKPDVVFNALHGVPGEDGSVQGMLDLMQVPYTHAGLAASVVAIDKQLTKQALTPHGIPMPGGRIVRSEELYEGDPIARPYVLKPVNEGSSVGVAIVTDQSDCGQPIRRDAKGPWQDFAQLLAEPFIRGRELTTAVIDTADGPRALGVTELIVASGFYDYENKYTDGKTQHIFPADLPENIAALCNDYAIRAHALLGCHGTSRTDYRWDDERGEAGLFVLETNTQPGMTPLSLVPEQARGCGIAYPRIVRDDRGRSARPVWQGEQLMARTATRNTKGVRRQARAAGTSRKVRSARRQGSSLIGRLLGALPFTEEQLHRAFTVAIFAGLLALAWFLASISGATALASDRLAHVAANAGFEVRNVEVRGVDRINKMTVYERAFGQRDLAMTKVELAPLREDLLTLPWVRDASVSRQLPDTLVIDIVEREPHAVLARADRLMLIDATGVELEPITAKAAEGQLLIEGPGAQGQVEALSALLEAAPALRQQVARAEWVGNRRWNLTFGTEQRLALPEGADLAAAALISFAQADGAHRLIGGEAAAFDMRNPPRMFMRVPGSAKERELDLREGQS